MSLDRRSDRAHCDSSRTVTAKLSRSHREVSRWCRRREGRGLASPPAERAGRGAVMSPWRAQGGRRTRAARVAKRFVATSPNPADDLARGATRAVGQGHDRASRRDALGGRISHVSDAGLADLESRPAPAVQRGEQDRGHERQPHAPTLAPALASAPAGAVTSRRPRRSPAMSRRRRAGSLRALRGGNRCY